MKILTLATSTSKSFLHNRLIVAFLVIAVCIILLMMAPLFAARHNLTPENRQALESTVLQVLSEVMAFVSGLGSLLAAWSAADSLSAELKSGTVLAVMARPVKRWEFLLGKYLGVLLFMSVYIIMMIGLSHLLAAMAGQHLHVAPWILILYPLVRYSIYAALAMFFATFLHPVMCMGAVFLISILTDQVAPQSANWTHKLHWLQTALYYLLPSTNLLTESRFLSLRQASIKQAGWLEHALSLGYGLDCAIVLFLLAAWSFHYRSLRQE
jgi:ABC-type transport system involved in multi-copper enzyme maturation permease subunit